MLASSVKRRLVGAICVAALVYSLIAMLVINANQPTADAVDLRNGSVIAAVDVLLTSTAAPDYAAVPGSSPALKLITTNTALRNCIVIAAGNYANTKACLQNANIGKGDATFTIEPGYSPDTDFQLLSGTQLPVGFRFAGRGGRPGNSGQNPVNLSGGHDSGTATAMVCYDGVFIGGFSNTCKWAREAQSGDTISGNGPGGVNCPRNWNSNAETTYGRDGTNGIPHIVMVTNDAGPVNRSWGPQPPRGYSDPQGQLWDVRRQRWAYARWTVVGCAGLTIGSLGGSQGFMIFQSLFVYKDEPVPGAYTISMLGTDDVRLGSSGTSYKNCGSVTSTPPNPCNGIYELSLATDMFASNKRMARTQNVCGQYGAQAATGNGVTSPGPTIARNTIQLRSSGYPNCPTGVQGVVADSATTGTEAHVYAFDATTGALVNATGTGATGSAAAAVACMGGNLPYDSGVPAGPGPGSSTPSYGCARTVGNAGNYPHISPAFSDGRYYIRTNTGGPGYKLLVSPPQGSPFVPRWVGTAAPNGWADANTYSPSVGATPLRTGDLTFAGQLTNTVSSGTQTSGSVTRGGTWTASDRGDAVFYNSTGTTLDATATALTGNGTYNRAVSPASIKVRYSVEDGVGNPPLVGWYHTSGTPAVNFSTGSAVSPGALVTQNFVSGSTISGSLGAAAAGSSVYTYRNSDGQVVSAVTADGSGNWSTRVATAASAYKVYAVAPPAASLQNKWYNLRDSWGAADLVSAPQAGVNMTLPGSSIIQGYVKDHASAADIADAPVYAYNSTTGAFSGWTTTGSNGRYSLGLAGGATYKVLTTADASHENQWWSGAWSYGEATATAAPPTTANFSVRAAGNISGTSSTSGTPTAGYTIDVWNSTGTKSAGSTVSGAGGAYSVKLGTTAATGWQYRLRFTPPSGTLSSVRWYLDSTGFAGATSVSSPATGINQDTPA